MDLLDGLAMLFGLTSGDVASIISIVKLGLGVVEFVEKIWGQVNG